VCLLLTPSDPYPGLPLQVNQANSIRNWMEDQMAVVKQDGSVWWHYGRMPGQAWDGEQVLPPGTMV